MQISTHGQSVGIRLFHFGNSSIYIEQTDMAENQVPNSGIFCDATNDRRRSVKRTSRTCCNGEMHN